MKINIALLALVLALGAYLRFEALGAPSYWLDEVLGQQLTTAAIEQPWWQWLTGSEAEHGPLYYATQAATRLAGDDEFAGRLAAALFGLATIALVGLCAPRPSPSALSAAALLAVSPFHVYYSREARPYALLMFLTAALLVLLLRGAPWWHVTLVLVAMLYTSAVAAPIVAAAGVAALFSKRRTSAIPALVIGAAFLLLYRSPPGATAAVPFGTLDADFFTAILRSFTVSAFGDKVHGRSVMALCVAAIFGAVTLFRSDRRTALVILAMTVLPVAFAVAALKITGHWFALRYIGPGLIGFVVLAGTGIAAICHAERERGTWGSGRGAQLIPRSPARPASSTPAPMDRVALAITVLIIFATVRDTWSTARREPFQKLDWRAITAKIVQYAKPGDLVIAAEPSTGIISDYYLARLPNRVVDIQTSSVPIAEQLRSEHPATFIVSTNSPGDAPMRQWACAQLLLLASPIDNFRMHYAGDFLRERAQAPERRAVAAGLDDAVLFREGWAGVEGSGADAFRWAIGDAATILAANTLLLRMSPLDHPSLPKQRVRISVDGHFLRELTLDPGWTEHVLELPDALTTVTFAFSRATAPATLDPKSGDTRRLAVAFRLHEANVQTRIASIPLIDENAAWRHTRTKLTRLRRDTVLPLLGRLGYDPASTWPRLERGELHLEDLAESIAYGSDCVDDATFLRNVYALLLRRAPPANETLRMPRVRFIGRLVKSDEFRALVYPARRRGISGDTAGNAPAYEE